MTSFPDADRRTRDNVKNVVVKSDDRAEYMILSVENQLNVHYAMPIREMLQDAMQYDNQVKTISKNHKKLREEGTNHLKEGAEYLSGFAKNDKINPVISLVVLWNGNEWDGPRTLHDMLKVKDKELLAHVPDYKLNIIEPQSIRDKDFEKFHSKMNQVFKYIKYSKNKAILRKLVEEDEMYRTMDRETAELINVVTNSKLEFQEEGEAKMALLMRRLIEAGRNDDVEKAAIDEKVRMELYKEFGVDSLD